LSDDYKRTFEKIQSNHIQKLEKLRAMKAKSHSNKPSVDNSKWVINRTDLEVPENVQRILSLGPKFNPPCNKKTLPIEKLICDIETAIQPCDDPTKITMRGEFVNIVTNFFNKKDICTDEENRLQRDVKMTKDFINQNPGIFITKADKGNITVVIDRQDYINGLETMFADRTTYERIDRCKTTSVQTRLNKMVSRWQDMAFIDFYTAKKLKSQNGVIARAYGLPKVHKPGNLYRPIVSSVGTPLYNLSKFLCDILKSTIGLSEHSVKNSMDFRTKIKDFSIPDDHKLVSFDVVSLFTNIDNRRVLDIVNRKWNVIKSSSKTKLSKLDFLDALELVTDNCEFSFNGQKYKQKYGSPMGSPVSPMLANMVLEDLEEQVLKNVSVKPLFYYRYVDDVICALPENKIEEFNERLNSYHRRLQFTVEIERESQIAFLDTLLVRESNGKISMNWYHKPTWSGRYLNFDSWLPMSYKVNTIALLTNKILDLSDTKYHKDNFRLLVTTLCENGYPRRLIKDVMYRTRNKTMKKDNTQKDEKKYVSVPYVRNLFEKIRHMFSKYNIELVGKAGRPLENFLFSRNKDKIPKQQQSNIVYNIECECRKVYIGQTSQYFQKRFQQHQRDGANRSESAGKSALSQHLNRTDHRIDFAKTAVLRQEQNRMKRDILEMIEIKKTKGALNLKTDTCLLPQAYDHLLFVVN
jgi:predicted GIY-YIG superfamily endonuclease